MAGWNNAKNDAYSPSNLCLEERVAILRKAAAFGYISQWIQTQTSNVMVYWKALKVKGKRKEVSSYNFSAVNEDGVFTQASLLFILR